MKKLLFYGFLATSIITALLTCGAVLFIPILSDNTQIPFIFCLIVCLVLYARQLSFSMTNHLTNPINALDPAQPFDCEICEELSPLLRKLHAQHVQIARQMDELERRKLEFDALTNNMSEGLVILDDEGAIVSCNRTATMLLQAENRLYTGENVLHLTRDLVLRDAAELALEGTQNDFMEEKDGRHLHFFLSPVSYSAGLRRGVVVLILDVSAQYEAERSRREFTANVSHELKTPLTSVLGYAEMITTGLAMPADVPKFTERIHAEAAHLLTLLEDIIKLSRLDEHAVTLPFSAFDMVEVAQECVARLESKAQENGITITMQGTSCAVYGARPLVSDIISNLCENAIKYNRPNGTVTVYLHDTPQGAQLIVADTGYGIAESDQARVFERFYRADKSRSREVAGTGLGLSIVKHICETHNAQISLQSNAQGTRFIVQFPPASLGKESL